MDDRYLFFTLADEDYFDVPWGSGCPHPLTLPPHFGADEWRRADHGAWTSFTPVGRTMPSSGWKIHVGCRPDAAQETVDAVAAVCRAERAAWKFTRSASWARVAVGKYAPASLGGKFAVVYSRDDTELARLVDRLAVALGGMSGAPAQGDHQHPDAPIGLRWGAFHEAWVVAADGRTVPGVREGDALGVDDRRCGRAVPLPPSVAALMRDRRPPQQLPIQSVRTVHRSNAGALYDAVLSDGRRVALKEARRYAGYDHDGSDAVTRLRHEHAVLQRLSGHGVAPDPLDFWEQRTSEFLVMEWLGDETVIGRVSREHPAGRPGIDTASAVEYREWAARVATDLDRLVAEVHRLGVTHGDLHPGNVMLTAAGLRLVDFEAASLDGFTVTRSVGTPGFVCTDPDPVARDMFALDRSRSCLHDPDFALVDRRPDLAVHLSPGDRAAPDPEVPSSTGALLDRLADDIVARATPDRPDRLFCGGVEQFTRPLGGHDLLSGAAGVLLALHAYGRSPDPRHLDWLAAVPTSARGCRGLAEGIEGVALALAVLGRPDRAGELMDRLAIRQPTTDDDISWSRGLSGCAIGLLELGDLLDRDDLRERGCRTTEAVVDAVRDESRTVSAPGLLSGWAGIALALLRIHEIVPSMPGLVAAARAALERELGTLQRIGPALVAPIGGKSQIGVGYGSGAFVLASHALADAGGELTDEIVASCRAATQPWTEMHLPTAGLMAGMTGGICIARAEGDDVSARRLVTRVGWHCVPTRRGWSVLGAQRLRCSDDLATGSAGLLVGLDSGWPRSLATVLRIPAMMSDAADDSCHPGLLVPVTGTTGESPV